MKEDQELNKILDSVDLSEPMSTGSWNSPEYEFVSFRLNKEAAKVIKDIHETDKIQEKIVRRIVQSKFNWLDGQIGLMDETVIKYQAHCIKIKDQLSSISESYEEALSSIEDKLFERQDKLKEILFTPFKDQMKEMETAVKKMEEHLSNLDNKVERVKGKINELPNSYQITEVIRIAGEWDKLSDRARELVAPLFVVPAIKEK